MNDRKTVVPRVGMNVLMCPGCAAMNEKAQRAALRRGKALKVAPHFGTLFVPVTLEKKAAIEAGHTHTVKAVCHSEGHSATVKFAMAR